MFGSNIMDFFTGRMNGVYKAGVDGSLRLSLPEILKGANIASGYRAKGINSTPDIIMENLKKNGLQMATTVILTPIAFSVAKKVLRKPILTPTNRLLKSAGLGNSVRL
jgi:hypothetical protein